MPVPDTFQQRPLRMDEAEFLRLHEQVQQQKNALLAMFDALDDSYREKQE